MGGFHYLKAGLSVILIFIGVKMLAAEFVHIPVIVSLAVVVCVLSGSIIASLVRKRRIGKIPVSRKGRS
jgi:tellurite resistance protein TerC